MHQTPRMFASAILPLVFSATLFAQSTRWSPIAGAVPAGRSFPAVAFDEARGRLVVFGGQVGLERDNSTWEFDGVSWQRITTVVAPSPRSSAAMAYSPVSGTIVLFGGTSNDGNQNDTWEWDGTQWTEVLTATLPPQRFAHAMSSVGNTNRIAMFGGRRSIGNGFSLLSDTWEFDGSNWIQVATQIGALSPPARSFHAATPDRSRGRMLIFGGVQITGPGLTDFWSWDGSTWVNEPAPPRGAVGEARIAHDAARDVVVLYGGQRGNTIDVAEFDGSSWSVPSVSGAVPVEGHSMVFDSVRNAVLTIGGGGSFFDLPGSNITSFDGRSFRAVTDPSTTFGFFPFAEIAYDSVLGQPLRFGGRQVLFETNETYTFDGSRWVRLSPSTRPLPRSLHAMERDRARGNVVLFGGQSGMTLLGDTWTWDGANWQQRTLANAPRARTFAAMAYDEARERVVMYGGQTVGGPLAPGGATDETWEWDGSQWIEQTPANSPGPLLGASMAYDASRGKVVLFGGATSIIRRGEQDETWEYDGVNWTQVAVLGQNPPARSRASMVYDAVRQRIVMGGGRPREGLQLRDTWEFNGRFWFERTVPSSQPSGLLFFDEASARTYSAVDAYETWEYASNTPPVVERLSAGSCASAGIRALPLQYPVLGRDLTLAIDGVSASAPIFFMLGRSATVFGGVGLPLALDGIGMPGCLLLQSADVTRADTANAQGQSTLQIAIPADPALLTQELYVQGALAEPGANALGLLTTDALRLVVGN